MTELLVLPAWNTPPRSLQDWVAQLTAQGVSVTVERESAGVSWIEVASMRLRGYAMSEGERLEAVNFELAEPDPTRAAQLIEVAAAALGWEVHPDEPDDDDDAET
jgi:hypothetical protein